MEITTEVLEQYQENKLKFIEQTSNMEIIAITLEYRTTMQNFSHLRPTKQEFL
jgi:hypothetical protein